MSEAKEILLSFELAADGDELVVHANPAMPKDLGAELPEAGGS